jgi:hypothetical protein
MITSSIWPLVLTGAVVVTSIRVEEKAEASAPIEPSRIDPLAPEQTDAAAAARAA